MKNFTLNNLIRPNILELKPYKSFRDMGNFQQSILLDANENPFGKTPRYPDSTHRKLREKIAELYTLNFNQVFVGNGSDEILEVLMKILCEPKKDAILVPKPSFTMYSFYAKVQDVEVDDLHFTEKFSLSKNQIEKAASKRDYKMLFLCSPNNPTGNSLGNLEELIASFSGIVVVDEAYQEFSEQKSAVELLSQFPNLIVLRTFSKAWGIAGARVGYGLASKEISDWFYTVKSPYNVSVESQNLAINVLENKAEFDSNLKEILIQKSELKSSLEELSIVKKIYPSDANFFLVEFENAEEIHQKLIEKEILTSLRKDIPNTLRITVGTEEENQKLIKTLRNKH